MARRRHRIAIVATALGLFLGGVAPAGATDRAATVPLGAGWTLDAYRGLGAWADLYDWAYSTNFGTADIDALAARGVHTLYLQGMSQNSTAVVSPDRQRALIDRAHLRHMVVVGWYLPSHTDPTADYQRGVNLVSAMPLDGLSLNIEATNVADYDERSRRAVQLAADLDAAIAGPISATVIPPVLAEFEGSTFWPNFPYAGLAPYIQAWLPMAYWTARTRVHPEYRDAELYTYENVVRIRQRTGQPYVPVHVVGGAASETTVADILGMDRGAARAGAVGSSIYDSETTAAALLAPLRAQTFAPLAPMPAGWNGSIQGFVSRQYQDVLGRSSDPRGLVGWVGRIGRGTTPPAIASEFATSAEFFQTTFIPTAFYPAIFGRFADPVGLAALRAAVRSGAGPTQVVDTMLASAEYQSTTAPDDASFVTALYQRGLGRAPDAGGLAHWVERLGAGVPRADVVFAIAASTEYVRRNVSLVLVQALYTSVLGRSADPTGLAFWRQRLDGGTSYGAVASSIVDSPEYRASL